MSWERMGDNIQSASPGTLPPAPADGTRGPDGGHWYGGRYYHGCAVEPIIPEALAYDAEARCVHCGEIIRRIPEAHASGALWVHGIARPMCEPPRGGIVATPELFTIEIYPDAERISAQAKESDEMETVTGMKDPRPTAAEQFTETGWSENDATIERWAQLDPEGFNEGTSRLTVQEIRNALVMIQGVVREHSDRVQRAQSLGDRLRKLTAELTQYASEDGRGMEAAPR